MSDAGPDPDLLGHLSPHPMRSAAHAFIDSIAALEAPGSEGRVRRRFLMDALFRGRVEATRQLLARECKSRVDVGVYSTELVARVVDALDRVQAGG